jgi:hypothetical protein
MASFFAARSAFAAALSEVAGVQGYAWKPSAPKVGDGWPRWQGSEHIAPGAMQTTWQIVILLPTDEQKQQEWIEARLDELIDALVDAADAWVVSVEPGTATDRPALMINCRE